MMPEDWKQAPLLDRLGSYRHLAFNHICLEARLRIKEHKKLLSRTRYELTKLYILNPNNKKPVLLKAIDEMLEKK